MQQGARAEHTPGLVKLALLWGKLESMINLMHSCGVNVWSMQAKSSTNSTITTSAILRLAVSNQVCIIPFHTQHKDTPQSAAEHPGSSHCVQCQLQHMYWF
jgi:hypothetical protein